ncbi:TolC family protein [Franzmannia qiaohouensis]|uniref:TolC family protein n=1 Tax=Franzmannia qiaohouensis TaxID=1329370 RepID=A0ABU1HIG3_9GAMM|nr:TolC family protein [Halomonas qiaohouensis]MDR5907284.1 TolC family protein [Halomonas qiaohouensis]
MIAGSLKGMMALVAWLPVVAWAASVSVAPADLPRGSASLVQLEAELERLSAGREPLRLIGDAQAPSFRDADDLEQGLRGERDPFIHLPDDLAGGTALRHIAIVGPAAQAQRAAELLAERASARDIRLSLHPPRHDAIAEIAAADIALILALPALDADAQRDWFEALTDAGVPGVALSDPAQVEHGALLSLPGAVDEAAWLRRLALRLDDRAAGRPVEALDAWPTQGREWLNLATARALGWSPDFALLTRARLLEASWGEAPGDASEAGTLSLEQAIALALSDNLNLEIARHEVDTEALAEDEARSRWRPNLYLEATGRQIDEQRAALGLGQQPERRATAGVTLEQLLFSEPALAALTVSASLDRVRRAELEVESLDLALETAREFLDALRLDAQLEVLREDLELVDANLRQAERREAAGAAGREERMRFESERAQARERLDQAQAQREQLRLALNRRLGRAPSAALRPQAPDTRRPEWLAGDERFAAAVRSPARLEQWQTQLLADALRDSRELQALAAGREAAQRELVSRRRAFWAPEVGLQVSYERELYRDGAGDSAPWESDAAAVQAGVAALDDAGVTFPETGSDAWSVGISARLPLYAGGRRSLERERSARQLESVTLREEDARQGIETQLRAASVELAAAWRRIGLRETSRDNAVAARDLVESAWREGAAEQVALLDAQTSARQAQLAEVEARWQYLQSLIHLQRALGMLPGPLTPADRDRLLASLPQ